MTTIGSLFSGVGGLELGLEMCGPGPVIWQCDSDPCARAVLEEHWPGVVRYEDVRAIDGKAERPDIICGGFPCQPVSLAGKRRAQKDTRWLWPFFAAALARLRPRLVFIENVPGLRTAGLREVLSDLTTLGFDAEWDCFSAAEVGAPQKARRRIFILAHRANVANAHREGKLQQGGVVRAIGRRPGHRRGEVADAHGAGLEKRELEPSREERASAQRGGLPANPWPVEPDVGRVAYGVPARMDRLRLLGNACVPEQAAAAFRALSARASL